MPPCQHLRKTIESADDAAKRWAAGEDDDWLITTCKDCGEDGKTPSERQLERREDKYGAGGIEQIQRQAAKRIKSGSRRLHRRRRDNDDV